MLSAPESRTIDENRYDRQLRLWGDRGQKSIARAHVCVLNATTLATEILKSLILAGIERFTIVDANRVDETDVGNNFFIDGDSIGRPRAQIAYQLLQVQYTLDDNNTRLITHI
jgi:amyloid beta precursor protein binding protein 1